MEAKQIPLLLTVFVFIFTLLTRSSATHVFIGCGDGIYSAEVKSTEPWLDFNQIVSTDEYQIASTEEYAVRGISHQENPKELFYIVGSNVYKCDFSGANRQTVITDLDAPIDLYVQDNTTIYISGNNNKIYGASIDGTNVTVLYFDDDSIDAPWGIVVDSYHECRIYWGAYYGEVLSIRCDGTGIEAVVSKEWYYPRAVTIDKLERTLYTAVTDSYILRKNLNTSMMTKLFTDSDRIYDMAILNDDIIFVEKYNGLMSVPKKASGPVAAQQVNTTGLGGCRRYYSIHVTEDTPTTSTAAPMTQNITRRITRLATDISSGITTKRYDVDTMTAKITTDIAENVTSKVTTNIAASTKDQTTQTATNAADYTTTENNRIITTERQTDIGTVSSKTTTVTDGVVTSKVISNVAASTKDQATQTSSNSEDFTTASTNPTTDYYAMMTTKRRENTGAPTSKTTITNVGDVTLDVFVSSAVSPSVQSTQFTTKLEDDKTVLTRPGSHSATYYNTTIANATTITDDVDTTTFKTTPNTIGITTSRVIKSLAPSTTRQITSKCKNALHTATTAMKAVTDSCPGITTEQYATLCNTADLDVIMKFTNSAEIEKEKRTYQKSLSSAELISHFDALTNIFPFDDDLNQTQHFAIQRFTIMKRNQPVTKQLVVDDLTYKVKIPAAAIDLHDDVGFLVIAVLTSLNPSEHVKFQNNISDVTYGLAAKIISINLFDQDGHLVKFVNETYPVEWTISLQKLPNPLLVRPLLYNQALVTKNILWKSSELVCAFWSESNWSQKGLNVSVVATNQSHLTCLSDHLTTFAALFQFTEQPEYSAIVGIMKNIGSTASIVALILGIFAFGVLLKSSNSNNSKLLVHVNLMTAMLLAYILLIISEIVRTKYQICLAITILLFDAFVSVFAWTAVEALHLFRMIVVVYGIERDLKWLYMFIGWGIPLLITGVTSAIGRGQLIAKHSKQCWLDGTYIWAFIGPVVFILLINAVILGVVIQKTISAAAGRYDQSVKTGLRCLLLLMPMLGVAWILGLAVNVHIGIGYMFDILSSLQGVYLVIVICIINTEIRESLKREWKKRRNAVDMDIGQFPMRNIPTSTDITAVSA